MRINNICCIGAGYVGGPTMAVIASMCPNIKVTVVDLNSEKINAWNGPLDRLPVFEPGLSEVIEKSRGKNLFFSTEIAKSIDEAEMIFIAVNTPTKDKGDGAGMAADLRFIESTAKDIARYSSSKKIVIEKSTLPVRTAEKVKEILNENNSDVEFEILSNPEFLAEGSAIKDLYKSDRVLIGGDNTESGQQAVGLLVDIYKKWIPEDKILTVNVWSSELSNLASNAMIAQIISSINSLSALCEKTGADIDEVSLAIGMDKRIGKDFLKVSPGFGGSCFQKDILNLVYLCQHYGLNEVANYWKQVIEINNFQRQRICRKVDLYLEKNNKAKNIAILGWAFKSNTNDSRESSSIYISYDFLVRGYEIIIYDPKVSSNRILKDIENINLSRGSQKIKNLNDKIKIYQTLPKVIEDSSIFVVLTEWDEFKALENIDNNKVIFDFRNFLDKKNNIIRF